MLKFAIAAGLLAFVPVDGFAQEQKTGRQGPPPRFITVRSLEQAKGEVIFDVQIVVVDPSHQPTILVYPSGSRRLTLLSFGKPTKPSYVRPAEGFTVSLKKAKWRDITGKAENAEAVAKRLKPGVMVLLSADGAEVDQAYLGMFKEGTLVLAVSVDESPIPYDLLGGSSISEKKVGEP